MFKPKLLPCFSVCEFFFFFFDVVSFSVLISASPRFLLGNGIALSSAPRERMKETYRGRERATERCGGMRRLFSASRCRGRLGEIGCDRVRANTASHPRAVSLAPPARFPLTPALLEATKYLTHWRIGNPLRFCTLFNPSPLLFIEYIYGAERVAQRVA